MSGEPFLPEAIPATVTAWKMGYEAAKAEMHQDWDLLKETQAALRDAWAIIKKLKAVLEQQAEPECWCHKCNENRLVNNVPWRESASDYERGVIDGMQKQAQSSVDKAVNAMTQRPWVGLEIEEVQDSYNADYQAQTRAIEAKLKEKNT